jgi:predicted HAD superfamily Cof-like phosphohydrolase
MLEGAVKAMLEFHEKFGVNIKTTPGIPAQNRQDLRRRLNDEEYMELVNAIWDQDLIKIADGIGDLIYVLLGQAVEYGIPIDEIFTEIHRSNMTKLWPDGTVKRNEYGKILKPSTYSPPDIIGILRKHGAKF